MLENVGRLTNMQSPKLICLGELGQTNRARSCMLLLKKYEKSFDLFVFSNLFDTYETNMTALFLETYSTVSKAARTLSTPNVLCFRRSSF